MITLFYARGACSMASHIALEETGVEYDARHVSFSEKENYSEAYLRINPRGKVPALVVNDEVLTENVAILSYIARQFPEMKLLPDDSWTAAQCFSRMVWYSNTVHPSFTRQARPSRFSENEDAHPSIVDMGRNLFWENCRELDSLLSGKGWAMGDQYTVIDPYTLIFYDWGLRIKLPMAQLQNFTAYKDRMRRRPAVERVLVREASPIVATA